MLYPRLLDSVDLAISLNTIRFHEVPILFHHSLLYSLTIVYIYQVLLLGRQILSILIFSFVHLGSPQDPQDGTFATTGLKARVAASFS